jgi:hypothetical protein
MSLKAIVVPEMKYRRVGESKSLRNLLKYLQYRDGSVRRDAYMRGDGYGGPEVQDHVKPDGRDAKWVDRGMGEGYSQVLKKAHELQGRSILARTWVISPDPDLMTHIPPEQRFDVMRRVTERTVDAWYEDNGWGQPDYSYVIHDRQTNVDRKQQIHSHIITPGTIPLDEAGTLGRADHIVKKHHIRDLHRTSAEIFELEMERVLGRDRVDEILREREEKLLAERYPGSDVREQLKRARQLYDIAGLLKADSARKKAKKEEQKRRRTAQMRRHELRLYAQYARTKGDRLRSEGWDERRIAREAVFEAELDDLRVGDQERLERLRRKRQASRQRTVSVIDYGVLVADADNAFTDEPALDAPDFEVSEPDL